MSDPAISRTKAAMTAAAKANGTAQTGAVAAKDQTDPSTEAQAARRGAGVHSGMRMIEHQVGLIAEHMLALHRP